MKLGASTIREIAVLTDVDPRTVQACLAGKPGRELVRKRVLAELARRGIVPRENKEERR